jgi:hypothetical protein
MGIPSGNVVYAQPNGVGNGVGATLTFIGNSLTALDGVSVTSGQRLLIKNQANAVTNGVYTSTANLFVITRSVGEDTGGELNGGDFLFVNYGATQADTGWVQTIDTVVIGTSNVVFQQFSGAGTYTANTSAGLVLNGTVFSAKVDNTTTAFDGTGNISVKSGAILTTPNIGAATGTSLSVNGNITGGNVLFGSGIVSGTGNISGSYYIGNGSLLTGVIATDVGTLGNLSVTGNANVGNLNSANIVSATGNITGNNLVANASTISDSTTNGALVVAGGAGISGNVNVGGTASVSFGPSSMLSDINLIALTQALIS